MDELQQTKNEGSIWVGLGLGAAVNIGAVIVGVVTIALVVGIFILLGIGLVQAAWIIPMVLSFRKSGKRETAKGVIVAAVITLLLNIGCYGLVATIGIGSMH